MKILFCILPVIFFASCATKKPKETSHEAKTKLERKFEGKIGVSTKNEAIETFGSPSWCKPLEQGELCRFQKKTGTVWVGDKSDRRSYMAHDSAVIEFDSNGLFKSFAPEAQR